MTRKSRETVIAAEVARLDRMLRRRTLRPGARIAIGGARCATIRRRDYGCESYCDNGYTLAGAPVCAMAGCHRPREDHAIG